MSPEQIAEAALRMLVNFIADRIESHAGRDMAEQLLLDKLELRRKAQAQLEERRRGR